MERTPQIFCLMITGGNDRIEWARVAVRGFLNQDYPNKKLIILNNNLQENVAFNKNSSRIVDPNVQEYIVSKKGKTLGDLRNMSMNYVPLGSYYYVWDDDDERHPTLLTYLMHNAINSGAQYVLLKNRLNFNCANNSLWRSNDSRGLKHILGRKTGGKYDLKYLSKDTLEDLPVNDLKHNGSKTLLINNDPRFYVRFVHGKNTSPFVNYTQSNASITDGPYTETQCTPEDREYINSFIQNYSRVCSALAL